MSLSVTAACLGALAALGALERAAVARARRALPIRVHVNGTRGKSTVTRLVWSALRASGRAAVAKVTGTAPRLLLPDGSERPVPRRGRPSIREQVWLLRHARALGAEAVVVECMALRPELQWVTEHEMVRATVGVITNVRTDHVEIMGRERAEIAVALANTVPRRATLVVGEAASAAWFAERARALGTEVVVAGELPVALRGNLPAIAAANRATALAVTHALGIADEVAWSGFAAAHDDPGAAMLLRLAGAPGAAPVLDATAANDPESLALLLADFAGAWHGDGAPPALVYNHRADRAERLLTFAATRFAGVAPERVVVTGDRPALELALALRRRGCTFAYIAPDRLPAAVRDLAAGRAPVVLCGNTRGIDRAALTGERP